MNTHLQITGLSKSFEPPEKVVDQVSFSVNRHEIFALLGPSGCGKTTTLRMIAGFEPQDEGEVILNDRILVKSASGKPEKNSTGRNNGKKRKIFIEPEDRGIGFVFQDYALFPHLSVLRNVMFGLKNVPKNKREVRAEEILCMMGLRAFMNRSPFELSGGQQQRVALARAIAPTPELILLDEPFSNLDAVLRQSTRDEIRGLLKKAGMTAVLVTHDQEEALSFADRIAVMNEGRIEQIGTPEEVYYRPRTRFVAQFLGTTNLITAEAIGASALTEFGRINLNRPATGRVTLSIRPEHLTLEKPNPRIDNHLGEVVSKEFKGHDITYRVRIKARECLVHTDNRIHFRPGDQVNVRPLETGVVLEEPDVAVASTAKEVAV
ncbi:ABC transporter ATP-binding protein [Natronogracilivirga saccharolytica]|uniref:ABC transporter ATP-binding protein n=1 Tax=Natronogracilivirga saccharolytica TaxID=2812953 RepID=A0A8J7RKB2_9BACT|nr:ABC transporter ATP-binding protein [Natronogracilivirga saccharolytica]MBP3191239.1 ABC transporter ATP-binding protein [Natronogracilivirga saccharolytica]